ncbi:MAG: hypothetical protein OHK0052_18250 [Anaerolineales bacterium]
MKKMHLVVLVVMLTSLFLIAAAPMAQPQKPDLIRLMVDNRSEKLLTIILEGPKRYLFYVGSETDKTFTPERGEYRYTITACGVTVKGKMDLTTNKKIVMPACSNGLGGKGYNPNRINLSEKIKLVKMSIKNETGGYIRLVLRGPNTHTWEFKTGETKKLSLARGSYTYTVYGCGGTFESRKAVKVLSNTVLSIKCP